MTISRVSWRSALVAVLLAPSTAGAGPLELGGLLGARRFSDQSVLGAKEPPQTSLGSTIVVGPRVGLKLTSWLGFEAELPLTQATTVTGDLGVFWIERLSRLKKERVIKRYQKLGGRSASFATLPPRDFPIPR